MFYSFSFVYKPVEENPMATKRKEGHTEPVGPDEPGE